MTLNWRYQPAHGRSIQGRTQSCLQAGIQGTSIVIPFDGTHRLSRTIAMPVNGKTVTLVATYSVVCQVWALESSTWAWSARTRLAAATLGA